MADRHDRGTPSVHPGRVRRALAARGVAAPDRSRGCRL